MEADRITISGERLAVKLIAYARLHQYEAQPAGRRRRAAAEPGWMRRYPALPHLLFILTGACRTRLEGRINDLQTPAPTGRRTRPRSGAGSHRHREPRTTRPHPSERSDLEARSEPPTGVPAGAASARRHDATIDVSWRRDRRQWSPVGHLAVMIISVDSVSHAGSA
ncbi:hypothetical protein GCM10010261_19540 [Streptomyces pilosus]|nr:hypothetical protein GCM10010261_19540 [Streptomyces pilosus]